MGATCGRFAGRVSKSKLTLENGNEYHVSTNDFNNSLDGDAEGFSHVNWDKADILTNFELNMTVDN